MNIQNIMKQAQQMQKDLSVKQAQLESKLFPGKYSLVEIEMLGNKKLKKVTINKELGLPLEDKIILEDAILIAINNTMAEVDKESEKILGNLPNMPGLF